MDSNEGIMVFLGLSHCSLPLCIAILLSDNARNSHLLSDMPLLLSVFVWKNSMGLKNLDPLLYNDHAYDFQTMGNVLAAASCVNGDFADING